LVYALDTNIVIHYLRNEPNVRRNFNNAVTQGDDIVIPQIVNYEMRRGFRIFPAPAKEAVYKELLLFPGFCNTARAESYFWSLAEEIYEDLYRKRLTVGELDILIAAVCLEKNYTLVTANTKDFENIKGLQFVNWVE